MVFGLHQILQLPIRFRDSEEHIFPKYGFTNSITIISKRLNLTVICVMCFYYYVS